MAVVFVDAFPQLRWPFLHPITLITYVYERAHRSQPSSSQLIHQDRTNTEQARSILIVNKLRTKPVIDTIDSFLE